MIVTCRNCQTSFQLDESRVPVRGIRVRCSRCKEAFFLEHPSAGRDRAIAAVVDEAARSAAPALTPGATQDLPVSSEVSALETPDSSSTPRSGIEEKRVEEKTAPEEEDEWEFDRDPMAGAEAEEPEGQAAVTRSDMSSFGAMRSGASSGLSLACEDGSADEGVRGADEREDPGRGAGPNVGSAGAAAEADGRSAFGSVDDFSSLMDEDSLDSGPGLEADQAESDSLRAHARQSAGVGQYASGRAPDDLGEPEDWNFLGDDSLEPSGFPSPEVAADSAAGLAKATGVGSIGGAAAEPRPPLSRARREARRNEGERPALGVQNASSLPLARFGRTVGWLLVASIFSTGLLSGLWSTAETLMPSQATVVLAPGLRAEGVRASWLETARAGTLFIVSGELHNRGAGSASPSGVVQVTLLDANGSRLGGPPAAAGVVLAEELLREKTPRELRPTRNHAAYTLIHSTIEPGGRLAFQAIFEKLPPEAARFLVELSTGGIVDAALEQPASSVTPSVAPSASGEAPLAAPVDATAASPASTVDELTWGE